MDNLIITAEKNATVINGMLPAHENTASDSSSTGFIIGVFFACFIAALSATVFGIFILRRRLRLRNQPLLKEHLYEIMTNSEGEKHFPQQRISTDNLKDNTLTASSTNLHGQSISTSQGVTERDFRGPILNQNSNPAHLVSREIDTYMNTSEILNSAEFENYTSMPDECSVYGNATAFKVDQDYSTAGFESTSGQVEILWAMYENRDPSNGTESISVESGIDDISESYEFSMSRDQQDEIYANSENNNEIYANSENNNEIYANSEKNKESCLLYQQNQRRLYVNQQIQCDSYVQPDIMDEIYKNNNNGFEISMDFSTGNNTKETKQKSEKTGAVKKTFLLSGIDTNANYSEIDPLDGSDDYESYQRKSQSINCMARDNAFGGCETPKLEKRCGFNENRTPNYPESLEGDTSVYSLAGDFSCSSKKSFVEQAAGGGLYTRLREVVHIPVNVYDSESV